MVILHVFIIKITLNCCQIITLNSHLGQFTPFMHLREVTPLLVKCVGIYRSLGNSEMRKNNNTYKHGRIIIPIYWNDDSPMLFTNYINAIQIKIKYNSIQKKH